MKIQIGCVMAMIDSDDLIAAVVKHFCPEDVFPNEILEIWAEDSGYVKSEEVTP